jgi:hypothetical protein
MSFKTEFRQGIDEVREAHQASEDIVQGVTGQAGETQTMQRGWLEMPGSGQTQRRVAGCFKRKTPQGLHVDRGDACIGIADGCRLDICLLKQRHGIMAEIE